MAVDKLSTSFKNKIDTKDFNIGKDDLLQKFA